MKYGIALAEVLISDLIKFDVITVPRGVMVTIITSKSAPIRDKSGQIEPIPLTWANGWIVESNNWTQELTDLLNAGIDSFNAKYPANKISDVKRAEMIW